MRWIIIVFVLSTVQDAGAQVNEGLTVKMDGYAINLGGKVFFQPCEDSSKSIWQSLDRTSFALWYFREDLYLEALDSVGKTVNVRCYDGDDKKVHNMQMNFFYCSLEVDIMVLDTTRFKVFTEPAHKLLWENKEYPLEGFRMDNRVKKIIPSKISDLRMFYNYYQIRGYTIPHWLDEYIDKNILKKRPQKMKAKSR